MLVAAFVLAQGLDPTTPNPPGAFSFAVMGDAPYDFLEALRFRLVLQDLDAHNLTSVISIGDIFWRSCSDDMYRGTRDQFNRLRHPVVYTPGDNEWFDCWEPGSGSFVPQERLVRLRENFFNPPSQSLGGKRIALATQVEFVENARWTDHGIVFATVHLIGSANGMRPFPLPPRLTTRQPGAEPRRRWRGCAKPSAPRRQPTPPPLLSRCTETHSTKSRKIESRSSRFPSCFRKRRSSSGVRY